MTSYVLLRHLIVNNERGPLICTLADPCRLIGRFMRMICAKTGMIRALMVMIRASEIFCNVFVEVFVNYTIIQI